MPSQDNENAMGGLLRRSLARDSKARVDCPDTELLAAYFDQSLDADEAAGFELHFSTCPRCREQLAAMARVGAQQIVQPDLALEPALSAARPVPAIALGAARMPAQAKPAASGARSETKLPERKSFEGRWLDLRWLIPVAAVLILGTVSLIHFGSQTKNLGLNKEVAISNSSAPPQDQAANEADKKLESSEPQKMSPPEAKRASPPVARTKSAPKSVPTYSTPPAHPSAPPAAGTSGGGSGGVGGGGAPSYRGRPGGAFYGGHAGVVRPSMPGAARTTTGSHFSSGTRVNANSAPAQRVESNSAKKAASDENSAASQNSPADQNDASQDQSAAVESAAAAPPAPAPELNAALQKMPVSSDAAEPVKSPAPAPPTQAEEKSKSTETTTRSRSVNGMAAKSIGNFGVVKHSSAIVVQTADPNVIYRVARTGGLVELSTDGGNTWQSHLLDPPADINAHSAVAPKTCWLVGSSGAVFVTEDGKAWRTLPPPTSKNLVGVEAKDAYRATITSEDGQKWTTDDAGDIWYPAK